MIKGSFIFYILFFLRQVSTEDGQSLAGDKNFIFQEVSAKNATNINTLFYKEIFNQIKIKYYLAGPESQAEEEINNRNKSNFYL